MEYEYFISFAFIFRGENIYNFGNLIINFDFELSNTETIRKTEDMLKKRINAKQVIVLNWKLINKKRPKRRYE